MIVGHPQRTNKIEISEPLKLIESEIMLVAKPKSLGILVDEGLKKINNLANCKTGLVEVLSR